MLSPPEAGVQTSETWVNGLELAQKQSRSRPKVAGAVVAIERRLTEYYVAGDGGHHLHWGAPVVVPAQAACHAPLAEVLDGCWSLTVNDL